jgi:hypothetical protein
MPGWLEDAQWLKEHGWSCNMLGSEHEGWNHPKFGCVGWDTAEAFQLSVHEGDQYAFGA